MTYRLVSVVLPVHNQADHIGAIVEAYEATLATAAIRHELLLVTNACRDGSDAVCRRLSAGSDTVRTLHSEMGGWGRAVRVGLREAQGDLLCYTNSARTRAEDLKRLLLHAMECPGAVIKAERRIRDDWKRRLGSRLYNLECRLLFDLPHRDTNGTPKLFPRSFEKLLALSQDGDLIDAEFSCVCRRAGYPVVEVPIVSQGRHGGRSTTSYSSAFKMYWGALRLYRTLREATE